MVLVKQKHPLAIRWFHWINFPMLAIMLYSGTCIYWAYDEYKIGWNEMVLFKFYPDPFYKALNIPYHLAMGMAWHFTFMWVFLLNGIAYVSYTIISGEWRHLVPSRHSFKEALQVTLHDLKLSKKQPVIRTKYNGAQQIAYTSVVLMGLGSILTGFAIYKPVQLSWLATLLGGYKAARMEHFCLAIGYVLFFMIHVTQVIRAGWNNFRAMVAGFEVVKRESR